MHSVLGLGKERGKMFMVCFSVLGTYLERDFFFCTQRDSDGRPTAGAQVLVRVSMVPRHPRLHQRDVACMSGRFRIAAVA